MSVITIDGHLTHDATLKVANTVKGEKSVCNFNVAVNYKILDVSHVDYFSVSAWNGLAVACRKLKKGDRVSVVGNFQSNPWVDRDGNNRTTLQIMANSVALPTRYETYEIANGEIVITPAQPKVDKVNTAPPVETKAETKIEAEAEATA